MKDDTKFGLGAAGLTFLFVAVIAALILAGWGLSVALAPLFGAGNVHKDQNTSQNREYWSAKYNADMNQLTTDQHNIAVLKLTVAGPAATQQDAQNLQGLELNCAQDVTTYNTDAATLLGRQWLPASFPPQVSVAEFCQ